MWGSNSLPQDQESHTLLIEPPRPCPIWQSFCQGVTNATFYFLCGEDIFIFVQALTWPFHFSGWDLCWALPGLRCVSPQTQQKADVGYRLLLFLGNQHPEDHWNPNYISTLPYLLVGGSQHTGVRCKRIKSHFLAFFFFWSQRGFWTLLGSRRIFKTNQPTDRQTDRQTT